MNNSLTPRPRVDAPHNKSQKAPLAFWQSGTAIDDKTQALASLAGHFAARTRANVGLWHPC
jgi:hypothetical protein